MPTWVAIQKTKHQNTRWLQHTHLSFAKNDAIAPVLLAELTELLAYYPLAFVLNEPTNPQSFQLIALQSLEPGTNYFTTNQGKWHVPYIPSAYRSHPFMLAPKNDTEQTLCLNETSEFIIKDSTQGKAIINAQGELDESMQPIISFLQQCHANKAATQQAVDSLAKHQLIIPWPLEKQDDQGNTTPIKGVYQINATALKQLSNPALGELNPIGALELAHAQLHSKSRLKNLQHLAKLHHQENQTTPDLDLDQLFGENDDDMFRF